LNKLKINPLKFFKEVEKLIGEVSFVYTPLDSNKASKHHKASSSLVKDDISERNNDETAFSIKDLRLKEIKSRAIEIYKTRQYSNQAILHSEKLNTLLSELLSGSYKNRSSDAVLEYLTSKFENKFSFREVNWIGASSDSLMSLTKLIFESINNVDILLKYPYSFGTIHIYRNNENELEFSLFLASKILK
jgi:hypothetical protein